MEPNLGKYRSSRADERVRGRTGKSPTEWNVVASLLIPGRLRRRVAADDRPVGLRRWSGCANERDLVLQAPVDAFAQSYRLWLQSPKSQMTLHDQLAVARPPLARSSYQETLKQWTTSFTRIDDARKPITVCRRKRPVRNTTSVNL
jgi:hypothetical protein